MKPVWHLITGEYAPQPGGVGDYTGLMARELVAAGREVHVWARGNEPIAVIESGGVTVHRIAGRFGPVSLWKLGRALNRFPKPRRLLVQYVSHAYGWKSLNLPFAVWVWLRRHLHGDDVQTMFHEVWYPWVPRPWRHNIIAAVTRVMGFFISRASRICYVSTASWEPLVRSLAGLKANVICVPVPANVAVGADPEEVTAFKATLPPGPVIVHFGTYGAHIELHLTPVLVDLLSQDATIVILLLGRSGDDYRHQFLQNHPEWASRIVAPGTLTTEQVAIALRAADVALQPYPDGVSTRRTSVMATMANGVPLVTTNGFLSEPFWADSGLIVCSSLDPARLAQMTLDLIRNRSERDRVSRIASFLYEERFSPRITLDALLREEC
ncbi:glycosyltransferase family 4 protein [soil metagenome]